MRQPIMAKSAKLMQTLSLKPKNLKYWYKMPRPVMNRTQLKLNSIALLNNNIVTLNIFNCRIVTCMRLYPGSYQRFGLASLYYLFYNFYFLTKYYIKKQKYELCLFFLFINSLLAISKLRDFLLTIFMKNWNSQKNLFLLIFIPFLLNAYKVAFDKFSKFKFEVLFDIKSNKFYFLTYIHT